MTQISTSRRRTSRLSANANSSSNEESYRGDTDNDDNHLNPTVPPSRIPVKSPARSVSSTSNLGGMAMAYSPSPSQHLHASPAVFDPTRSSPSEIGNYAKKLMDLKNAMEMLKTPPPISKTYTPLHSSALAFNSSPTANFHQKSQLNRRNSYTNENEVFMEISSASSTDEENNSLLSAYNDDDSTVSSKFAEEVSIKSPSSTTYSPRSSPFISSEDLKRRIESSKKVFQKSFDEQRLKRGSQFNSQQDFDSSFSMCDPNLSIDSLNHTKNQLARIKQEISEIIESDSEDVNFVYRKTSKDFTPEIINDQSNDSLLLTILKFCLFFLISSVVFTYLIINFEQFTQYAYADKLEEIINFILQDN